MSLQGANLEPTPTWNDTFTSQCRSLIEQEEQEIGLEAIVGGTHDAVVNHELTCIQYESYDHTEQRLVLE